MKFYLLTLGCPKNQVDAEYMSALLTAGGYESTALAAEADILIVNGCSFIEIAREEAVEYILDLLPLKKPLGKASFLIITGCLPQMIGAEIYQALPEVDSILGTSEYHLIKSAVDGLVDGSWPQKRIPQGVGGLLHIEGSRKPTDRQYAYIKIAEGCSNHCSYCTIPALRGPQISRPVGQIVKEALDLAGQGVQEVILIAQDTTRYGLDLYQKNHLPQLLQELDEKLPPHVWIRMMYFYADAVSDELIETMAKSERILNYIDLPIQHASNKILKRMGRAETIALIKEKIFRLREALPGLILRTTVMVGFPGEEEEDVKELLDFIEEIRFDRLGCFIFSAEEGTAAVKYGGKIPSPLARERYNRVMSLQKDIVLEQNEARIGELTEVLLQDNCHDGIFYQGRSYGEAPEVDPVVWVAATIPDIDTGKRHPVRIVSADHYSLMGVTEYEYCE